MMIDETMWGHVAQCYVDEDEENGCFVGRIVWSDDSWVLMQMITLFGRWEGIALFAQMDFERVKLDMPYAQRLMKVINLRGEEEPAYPEMGKNPRMDMLNFAQEHQAVVSLEICCSRQSDMVGTVEGIGGGLVRVRQWTDDGEPDGETAVGFAAITGVFIGSEELEYIDLLRRV